MEVELYPLLQSLYSHQYQTDTADGIKNVAKYYSDFTQVLQENFQIVSLVGQDCFLPNPFYSTVVIAFDATEVELLTYS